MPFTQLGDEHGTHKFKFVFIVKMNCSTISYPANRFYFLFDFLFIFFSTSIHSHHTYIANTFILLSYFVHFDSKHRDTNQIMSI